MTTKVYSTTKYMSEKDILARMEKLRADSRSRITLVEKTLKKNTK